LFMHFRWLLFQLTELIGHQERCCLLTCWGVYKDLSL
jgi:hypothetical protein